MASASRERGVSPTRLVAIIGATGTGKSSLSLGIAEELASRGKKAEIINADAMQLYSAMDIGTAKLLPSERKGIPHHMLDVLSPSDEASVAAYQTSARAAVDDVVSRGATPILVGGSGLYVSSVVFDFQFPGTDAAIRARLESELAQRGAASLHKDLLEKDPTAAIAIGATNGRRIVRALEVVEMTGEPFRPGHPDENSTWMDTVFLGLETERATLVRRLDARVKNMWADGIVDEAQAIGKDTMGLTARRAIGYAQALAQLDGSMTESEAIEQTAALTRRYARRQVGWFRRYPHVTWLHSDDPQRVSTAMDRLEQ
jgi:tRNA dimethylallyltransferase